MEERALIKPFEESIYLDGLEDVAMDISEMALDDITSMVFSGVSNVILNIPIVKTAAAVGKLGWSVYNAVVLKNQLSFIQSLQRGNSDPKEVEKRRIALENNEKWIKKEIETSVVYLARYTNAKKAVYQARIYCDLINKKISFEQYEEYLTILDQLFLVDVIHLLDAIDFYCAYNDDFNNSALIDTMSQHYSSVHCRRLESLGLLKGLITSRLGISTVDRYAPTSNGLYLYTIVREANDEQHCKIDIYDGTKYTVIK